MSQNVRRKTYRRSSATCYCAVEVAPESAVAPEWKLWWSEADTPTAILSPSLSRASSGCTAMELPPKKNHRDHPNSAERQKLEEDFSSFLADVSKALQKELVGPMELYMQSMAKEINVLGCLLPQKLYLRLTSVCVPKQI